MNSGESNTDSTDVDRELSRELRVASFTGKMTFRTGIATATIAVIAGVISSLLTLAGSRFETARAHEENLFNQKRVAYVNFGAAVSNAMNSYINYRTDLLVSAPKGGRGQSLSEQELRLQEQKFLKVLSNTQNDLEKARVAEVVIGTNEANNLAMICQAEMLDLGNRLYDTLGKFGTSFEVGSSAFTDIDVSKAPPTCGKFLEVTREELSK